MNTSSRVFDFLNTSQSGKAHQSSGISSQAFFSSISFALVIFLIQVLAFSYLRKKFRYIYQPRSYFVEDRCKVPPPHNSFVGWCCTVFRTPLASYNDLGLDAYLFLRFLTILIVLFGGLSLTCIPILVPINFTGNVKELQSTGLDKVSISNVSMEKSARYFWHCLMANITIVWFHLILIHELYHCVQLKRQKLLSLATYYPENSNPLKTIILTNVSLKNRNKEHLRDIFSILPGGVSDIWFTYNHDKLDALVQDYKFYRGVLEKQILRKMRKQLNNPDPTFEREMFTMNKPIEIFGSKVQCRFPIGMKYIQRVHSIEYCLEKMTSIKFQINKRRLEIVSHIDDPTYLQTHGITSTDNVFITLNNQLSTYMAKQLLLSSNYFEMDECYVELNAKDIIWDNLQIQNSFIKRCRKYCTKVAMLLIIIGWVVPVALVGLVSHLPYLTALIPMLAWINKLPATMKNIVSGLLPTIALSLLTEAVYETFRNLCRYQGILTGAKLELEVQKWLFLFLFVQVFLVVSISSGITSVFQNLLQNPISIPKLVASDLPKASNFFFSFIVVRGLAYSGNLLLQLNQLLHKVIIFKFRTGTPRQRFKILVTLPKQYWGSIYPFFSLIGSIGLAYSILSPLILIICTVIFSVVLFSYKHCLLYVVDYRNESETFGKLYTVALRQLYAGVYCLEICLVGFFFLVGDHDENGHYLRSSSFTLGMYMGVTMLVTTYIHIKINQKFDRTYDMLPLDLCSYFQHESEKDSRRHKDEKTAETRKPPTQDRILMLHKSLSYQPEVVWIPRDQVGLSQFVISNFSPPSDAIIPIIDSGAVISMDGQVSICSGPLSRFDRSAELVNSQFIFSTSMTDSQVLSSDQRPTICHSRSSAAPTQGNSAPKRSPSRIPPPSS
ncbi:hypothetical protein LJB42_003271 [Komagataella kurtzmanii]|nr:hypothetical protein LJB42_003271 [Komagataella kurtzmanii]